jgi:hypothetical protein
MGEPSRAFSDESTLRQMSGSGRALAAPPFDSVARFGTGILNDHLAREATPLPPAAPDPSRHRAFPTSVITLDRNDTLLSVSSSKFEKNADTSMTSSRFPPSATKSAIDVVPAPFSM